jgi:hypothetical protein
MATAAKKKPTQATTAQADYKKLTINGMDVDDLIAMQDAKVGASTTFWNGKKFKLESVTKENEKLYLGQQVSDRDDGSTDHLSLDNRIFTSIRTIVPYVTTRITEPEVYPSSNTEAAKRFAQDMEKALHAKADKEDVKSKMKYALEDAIIRRRGYLKPRYDASTKNFCAVDYVPAESIIVDHKARFGEEPRYFRHHLDKSAEDLITMFPDMESRILSAFKITDKNNTQKMQEEHVINEDWFFVPVSKTDEEGNAFKELDLLVCWNFNKIPFGCIQDPNWRYDQENFLDNHMMPLVFVNILNDGRTYIDKTSLVEQGKYLQKTIDERGKQIGEAASLGSIGMPVIDSATLADDQSQYLTYEEDTVIELDIPEGKSVNDVFTTWKAQPLSKDVYDDKNAAIEGVQNAFGASNVFQGQQSDNHTLGQDELLRDQSMGRQQEIVDGIDRATNRLYMLMAQFMLVYGDETELFRFVGENSQFDYLIMNTASLDTNAEIRVKGGTSMPIDKPQRRATADKAAQQAMIDPLTYWEIMDEPNAQKIAKRLVDYTANPQGFLKDAEEEVFNRDAYVDIEILKQGGTPPYRDDLVKEYFDHLNEYVLSGNLENPKIPMEVRQAISEFIDTQLARAQKMLGMAETQLPTPEDVQAHNDEVDKANAAQPDQAGDAGATDPNVAAAASSAATPPVA